MCYSLYSVESYLVPVILLPYIRVIVQPPDTGLLNRVLRQFSSYHDRFLRISVSDEEGGSICVAEFTIEQPCGLDVQRDI